MKCEQCKRENGVRVTCRRCGRLTCDDCWGRKHNADVCRACEGSPAVTYEITGRVHEALRQFLREHRKSPDQARYLFATFLELREAIEADMPELLVDPTASPS